MNDVVYSLLCKRFLYCGAAEIGVAKVSWGYIVQQMAGENRHCAIYERALSFAGLGVLGLVGSLWLLPGANNDPMLLPFKLVLTSVFLFLAALLAWIAHRGVRQETHIDLDRGVLRQALRNRHGARRVVFRTRLEDVESLFILRGQRRGEAAHLFVRVCGRAEPVYVGSAEADALERLHRRVSEDVAHFRQMQMSEATAVPRVAFFSREVRGRAA
ncbi:hypothetical protein DXV76_06805 [Rhodobacteraceae bacterium CCMM004]|nr:hypothetical protein DXV76_06805 [Rhodobacteraceae bacterium CCMM004]